jgi:hypothetical protein
LRRLLHQYDFTHRPYLSCFPSPSFPLPSAETHLLIIHGLRINL